MLLSFLLNQLGVNVELAAVDHAVAQVAQVVELVSGVLGFVLVVWGRWKATKKIAA